MTTDHQDNDYRTSLTLPQAWSLWKTAQKGVKQAKNTEAEALRTVARAAGGKTFRFEGQLYQVRERKNKTSGEMDVYICKLKKPTREWLAEAREAKYLSGLASESSVEPVSETSEQVNDAPVDEPTQDLSPLYESGEPGICELEGTVSAAGMFEQEDEESGESTLVLS